MNRIDLIIEFCENMANMRIKGSDEALAAARELKALKPVAWVTTEQFASTMHKATRLTLHQERNGIPLYALEVTK